MGAEINLGTDGAGRRRRRKLSAASKAELESKVDAARRELAQGVKSSPTYTVDEAVDDWLNLGMGDKAPKTIATLGDLLAPVTAQLGKSKLRELTSEDVRKALVSIAETRSSRTVRDSRAALVRVITFVQARELIGRNVAALVKAPPGKGPRKAIQGPLARADSGCAQGRPRNPRSVRTWC